MNPVSIGLLRGPFLEGPGKFSGPKSNIQMKISYQGFQLVRSPRIYGETFSWVQRSLAYLSYPRRANFSFIFLQNLENRWNKKQTREEELPS